MDSVEKVRQRMAGQLQPEENVLYGCFSFRTGGVRKAMVGGALGIAGALGAAAMAAATSGKRTVPALSLTLPSRFYVGLTDQRLVIFSSGGAVVAKPKNLLHAYPLDRLAWLSDELVNGVAQAYRVSVGVVDTGVLNFEFPRFEVRDARTMASQIKRSLPPGSADEQW
ncbi:hypothetical protein [Catenulispora pinisilvae]|uniref:hypothetical protein n=1 Tax=Catenulispora pinisilvae TaxID=2705253 RepID=UPI001890D235|nr:hypothetical protein [Catenulispora pinisilvae]